VNRNAKALLAILSLLVVAGMMGLTLHTFWFHPEWTEAEAFWAYWPIYLGGGLWCLMAQVALGGRRD
jgi:hypothetical protein